MNLLENRRKYAILEDARVEPIVMSMRGYWNGSGTFKEDIENTRADVEMKMEEAS